MEGPASVSMGGSAVGARSVEGQASAIAGTQWQMLVSDSILVSNNQ